MTGAIIGPHIINGAGPHLAALRRWQPRLALLLDPNADDVRALRAVCPHTIIVGRIYVPDGEVDQRIRANPEMAAQWAHDLTLANSAVAQGLIDYVQIANEVLQFWDGLPLLNRFEIWRMKLADADRRYRCGILGFSVGQIDMPAADRLALWRLVYGSLSYAETFSHAVIVHQYGAPDLWGPASKGGADWLLHRLEHQVLPRLPFKTLKFAVTEYGIDGLLLDGLESQREGDAGAINFGTGIRVPAKDLSLPCPSDPIERGFEAAGPAGWSTFTTATDYVRQLTNVGQYCEQWSDRILGYAVFTLGHNAPWQTYDIAGNVAEQLAAYYTTEVPVPPPPPPPDPVTGGTMTRIYDVTGVERDEEWLYNRFGIKVVRAAGARFVLSEVRITTGNMIHQIHVQDDKRSPLPTHAVALHWPSAPVDLTGPDTAAFKTRYSSPAQIQWTNSNGDTGFELGPYGFTPGPPDGGPHDTWVLHDQYTSDVLANHGWLALTNHEQAGRLTFTLQLADVVTGALPEDEPLSPPAVLADKVRWWMEKYTRCVEDGNAEYDPTYGSAILYSLIKRDGGLLYRLENALKQGLPVG